jgi:hypothetical protein
MRACDELPERNARARAARAVAWVLLGLAAHAGWRTTSEALARPRSKDADTLARFAPLVPLVASEVKPVRIDARREAEVVGYLTHAEAFSSSYDGTKDPVLKAKLLGWGLEFMLAQRLLAPRLVVLPASELFAKANIVVGCYDRAEDVPDGAKYGLEVLFDGGQGVVLWRRR